MKTIQTIHLLMGAVGLLSAAITGAETLKPLSTAAGSARTASGNSLLPVVSSRSTNVAFLSHAQNLVTNDNSLEWLDVFVHDVASKSTALVSVNTNGTGGGNGNSGWVSFAESTGANNPSNNLIAFASDADDLVTNDTNGARDIFLRDIASRQTWLISVDLTGKAPPDPLPNSNIPLSGNPMATGISVFFESRATNLVNRSVPANSVNIYVRYFEHNTTSLVSRDKLGNPFTNYCELAAVSWDSRYAAFLARSSPSPSAHSDVYVFDATQGPLTSLASSQLTNYGATYRCGSVRFSTFGGHYVFVAAGLPQGTVLFRGTGLGTPVPIATNVLESAPVSISNWGDYVTYSDGTNIWRQNVSTGARQLINVNTAGTAPTNGVSRYAVANYDASVVVFTSNSPELVPGGPTNLQVYSRDLINNITHFISVDGNGNPSSGVDPTTTISLPYLGYHGVLDAMAGDFSWNDTNSASDVFLFPIHGPVSRVSLTRWSEGTTLRWVGNPFYAYRIEYKDDLAATNWTELSTTIIWDGRNATAADFVSPPHRFYRVVRLP